MKFEFDYQCDKEWDEMEGTDRRRHCDSCNKSVHHLSGMTKAQALKFLDARNWDVCVDFFTDADGNTAFRKEQRLATQIDGLKQLAAAALAIVPLALAAAFIDFDAQPEVQTVITTPDDITPIALDGPVPVVSDPFPVWVPMEVETPPEPVVVPVVVLEPEPEPEPAIIAPPKPRLRGRIARPVNW